MAQPQDQARFIMLIVLLLWLTSTPDGGPGIMSAPSIIAARLGRQRVAHGVLNSTQCGGFAPPPTDSDPERPAPSIPNNGTGYLNITGFREEDGYAWQDLGLFRQRCLDLSRNSYRGTSQAGEKEDAQWDLAQGWPTWHNATGIVHGSWVRTDATEKRASASYNLTQLAPTIPWAMSEFGRNITGKEGKILLRLDDKQRGIELPDLDVDESQGEGQQQPLVKTGGIIREVSAMASIEDVTGTGNTHHIVMHGVHWPRQGAMLLTTTSDKFAGIFGLPHLTPGLNFFRTSQKLLNETIGEVLRRKEKARFSEVASNPWGSYPNMQQDSWNPFPHCEYVMYLQVHPLDTQQLGDGLLGDKANEKLDGLIGRIEDELRFPTGAPLPQRVPDLQMSAVVYSPDCAYFLQTKGPPAFAAAEGTHLVGLKDEVYTYSTKLWLIAFAALMFAQVQLLKMQMRESSTPSTIARVSFWTASMMVLADGIVFGASSFLSLSDTATLLPSLLLTYAGFISMTIGGSFLYEVYKVQEPERRIRERDQPQQASPSAAPPQEAAARAAAARAVVTAAPPPTRPQTPPIIIPSDQDIDAEIEAHPDAASILPTTNPAAATTATTITPLPHDQPAAFSTILGRYILLGVVLLLLSLAATTWWARAREIYMNGLVFCYLSLWVPQIIRNVTRNSRRAFSWRFMVGQSVLRLMPIAYFYVRERNVAFSRPDRETFLLLVGWVWCQLWILGFQDIFGPRFGIPKGWAPEAWEYHPILREDNLEAGGLPIGLLGSGEPGSPTTDRGHSSSGGGDGKDDMDKHTRLHSIDCAICREVLEVAVVRAGHSDPAGTGGVAGVFARRQYMVTPCRHIFHSECLEGWLRFRLQCPICREDLPPL